MKRRSILTATLVAILTAALSLAVMGTAAAQTPKRGGTLVFIVGGLPPSFDGHAEVTFTMMHPVAPNYSLLIKPDPTDPAGTKMSPDIAESWQKSPDGLTYIFRIRRGVRFHDGEALTSKDLLATFDKLRAPPAGTVSRRKPFFQMIDSISTPDDYTLVFKLKYPTAAFLPVLAIPFNFIYSASKLAKDMNWYRRNVVGTGPFKFVSYATGSSWVGKRNEDYFKPGLPYLDGYEAIFSRKLIVRVQAIRSRRAFIEFRGFPPKDRDNLIKALGDEIVVQESPWNCTLRVWPNSFKKPFDDIRVRQALNLAIDRWAGSKFLSQIAIMKTVGHAVFPGHPLSLTNAELEAKIPGYSRDINASRAKARQLLRDAGVPEGFKFVLHNRAVDQPYKIFGTWLINQWKQIGLDVTQAPVSTSPWLAALRKNPPDYDIAIGANCQTVVNPTLDVSTFLSGDRSPSNYGHYTDRVLDDLYDRQLREPDQAKQKDLLTQYQQRLTDQGRVIFTMWWHRIIPHNRRVKGWNITPSHYMNQDLTEVWLDQ